MRENESETKMNKYFDFSTNQLKVLAVLATSMIVMGGYVLVRKYTQPIQSEPKFEIIVGEDEKHFTGVFVLDPNSAPADSLELLPGIGPIIAERIVTYRQESRFARKVDIMNVRGIGPRLYERLEPYLRIKDNQ